MKFSMLIVLLVFCASKVHYALSDILQSWDSLVSNLRVLDTRAEQLMNQLDKFYNSEILEHANITIRNEKAILIERMTNTSLAAMVHVYDHSGTNDCSVMKTNCIEYALRKVQNIIQNETNSFEKCENEHFVRTKSCQDRLNYLRQIQVETHLFIRNETETVIGSCADIKPVTAAEICLASRESKAKLFLQYISENVVRYKKYLRNIVSADIKDYTGCMSGLYYEIVKKIQRTENESHECIGLNEACP